MNKFKRLGEAKLFFANFNLAKNYACNVTIFVSVSGKALGPRHNRSVLVGVITEQL